MSTYTADIAQVWCTGMANTSNMQAAKCPPEFMMMPQVWGTAKEAPGQPQPH